jgi:Holliday junction resolvase RusA-like endonuclease
MNGGRVFDDHAHMALSMENIFESQLLGARKFKGNVKVEAIVFMPFPDGMGAIRRKERDGHYYRNSPTLAGMMRAVELTCGNLLFEKDTVIVAMSMEKRWSVEPRLEMIISELSINGKKDDEKEADGKKGQSA